MGIHDFLYKNPELPSRAVAVYFYLEDRANAKGECWPSIKRMAEELKLSESTIRRAMKDLKAERLLETKQRYRADGGKSSLCYRIKGKGG